MFSTAPHAQPTASSAMFVSMGVAPAVRFGMVSPSKGSSASTRATSPSSSTDSSEDATSNGALARRRGRSVLMLNELVVDFDTDKWPLSSPGGSPSTDSSSSWGVACGNSTRCTPFTPKMMSFAPSPSASATTNQLGSHDFSALTICKQQSMTRTTPLARSIDASQRSAACTSRLGGAAAGGDASQRIPCCIGQLGGAAAFGDAALRTPCCAGQIGGAAAVGDASQRIPQRAPQHGAAVAGGDASQRTPDRTSQPTACGDASQRTPNAGRVTLGVAVIGGDASQRSPPGGLHHVSAGSFVGHTSQPLQQIDVANWTVEQIIPLWAGNGVHPDANSETPQELTATSPAGSSRDSSCSSSVQDASHRSTCGSAVANLTVDGCSDAIKSWLSGDSSNADLVEKLRAAAPESYED